MPPAGPDASVNETNSGLRELPEAAEVLEQGPVALEIGPEHFGDAQDVMPVGHGGHDLA